MELEKILPEDQKNAEAFLEPKDLSKSLDPETQRVSWCSGISDSRHEILEKIFEVKVIKSQNRVVVIGSNKKYNSILVSHDYKNGKILMQEYNSLSVD